MGFINSLLGGTSGDTGGAGLNYQAAPATINTPVTTAQANTAYDQTQTGLGQQQAFINALSAQNGIANQNQVFGQQQALAGQLQGIANGTGPNPAQAQLAQATGQNVANQAALMAGQRGAGANVGLLSRQIAQQGAGIQQQAVGQGATLGAQQQLAALGTLQGQQSNLANLATQQVGQQANALTGYNQAAQSSQQNLLNSIAGTNSANVSSQGNQSAANSHIAGIGAQQQGSLLGGAINGAGSAVGAMAHGGMAGYAGGGPVSMAGQYLYGSAPSQQSAQPAPMMNMSGGDNSGGAALNSGLTAFGAGLGKLLGAPAPPAAPIAGNSAEDWQDLNAQGTGNTAADYQNLDAAATAPEAHGGEINLKGGGKVKGSKAPVKGDSYSNDTVPAMLSPKEIVIPRSITMGPNAPENAAKFVAAILAKQGGLKRGKA